jgi:hypothetical protein
VSEQQYRADDAFDARMHDPAFARAYDVWLMVLAQRAAEIELARSGLRPHRPRRSRVRPKTIPGQPVVPRTA